MERSSTGICDDIVSAPSNQTKMKQEKKWKLQKLCLVYYLLIASRNFFTWFFREQMVSLLFVN